MKFSILKLHSLLKLCDCEPIELRSICFMCIYSIYKYVNMYMFVYICVYIRTSLQSLIDLISNFLFIWKKVCQVLDRLWLGLLYCWDFLCLSLPLPLSHFSCHFPLPHSLSLSLVQLLEMSCRPQGNPHQEIVCVCDLPGGPQRESVPPPPLTGMMSGGQAWHLATLGHLEAPPICQRAALCVRQGGSRLPTWLWSQRLIRF